MTINYAHLRTFHAVAQEGGYLKAAEILGVAQPTLSLQVKALEERYEVKLFQKKGRGVELTAFGMELLDVTTRMFAVAEEVEDMLSGSRSLETGRLRLGASGAHLIVPLMRAFAAQYPGPQLSLVVKNTDGLLRDLKEGQIDVGVVSAPLSVDWPDAITLRADPIVAVVGKDHPWAERDGVSLADVAAEPLVLRETGTVTRAVLDTALQNAGLSMSRVTEIDDWETMRELVAAGLGVTVYSLTDAGTNPWDRFRLVPIRDADLKITERLVFAPGRRRLRIVRAFLDIAEEFSNVEWARELDTADIS